MCKSWWHWLERNEGLILILLLVIILRIPSLAEPYWYGDEGIYLTLGQALRKGLVFYRDIHDNKPPLLYLLAGLAGNVFYFRLLLLAWFSVTVSVFFRLMQLLLPKNKLAWYVSTLSLIGLTTIFEGNVANAEIFMALPVILGMILVFQQQRFFIIGLLFSLGFLFKVPAGFDLAAALIWLVWARKIKLRGVLAVLAGFALPIGATIIYYAIRGGLEPYVRSALMQNIGYLASWKTGEHSGSGFTSQIGLIKRTTLWLVMFAWFYALAKKFKLNPGAKLIIIWFLFSLFGALLSERPYPHYLIQPAVPAAILVSFFLFTKQRALKLIILGVSLIAAAWYYQVRFWSYPLLAYYQNYFKLITQQQTLEAYRNWFDKKVNQNYQIAQYLKEKTLPDEQIFIWGDEPSIYALSERLPVGRYVVAYHVIDFNGYQETMTALTKNPAKIIVVMSDTKQKFPAMEILLATDYVLTEKLPGASIYRRLGSK